jgi:putative N-acetylmannosamine-6-phosphate epimerase
MSGILQTSVKYHEKTADFQDRDCLVTKVLKGMGAIMKSPADVIAYFDAIGRDRIKQELKKE